MAEITNFIGLCHLRSEPTDHIIRFRNGQQKQSGPGVAFWFTPMSTAIAKVPVDVRELPFLIQGKTNDFQDITIQGQIAYRVIDPETLSTLIDFSINLRSGYYIKEPLDQVANLLIGSAQQTAVTHLASRAIREALNAGAGTVRSELNEAFARNNTIAEMGIDVLDVQVNDVRPNSDLQKALQTPTREQLQQQADEAAFERPAMAVENERAIAENELNNKIELAKRENALIDKRGANAQRKATEKAAATAIIDDGRAQSTRVLAEAKADQIRFVESAQVAAERDRLDIYRDMTPAMVMGLAAQELASKLTNIEHLNVKTPQNFPPPKIAH